MLQRNRIGFLGIWLMASIVACDGSESAPLPPDSPVSTTTAVAVASTYVPENPGPVAVVERFLTAEIAGDFEASFDLLSHQDQEAAGGVEGWVADHFSSFPQSVGSG